MRGLREGWGAGGIVIKAGGAGRVRAQQVREQLDRDLEEGHGIAMHAGGSQDA